MNAVVIRCPTCNAALNVSSDAMSVVCNYCHTPCRIQQRTRIFQVPRPVQGPPQMPVAKVPVNRLAVMIVAGALGTMTLGGVLAGALALRANVGIPSSGRHGGLAERPAADKPNPELISWESDRPLLRDLDGDGEEDLIGAIESYVPTTNVRQGHLAAYSGKDGHILWRSEPLPSGLGNVPKTGLAGDLLVVTGDDGNLHAYQVSDGKKTWTASIGEKVRRMCGRPDGVMRVLTEDERATDVVLATGATSPAEAPKSRRSRDRDKDCDVLPDDTSLAYGQDLYDVFRSLPDVRGMDSSFMTRRGDVAIIAGGKEPGTSVPMLARLDKRAVVWTKELPSSNPLTARHDEKLTYFDDRVVLAIYSTTFSGGEVRLAALDPSDGNRKWEAVLDSGPSGAVMSTVFATKKYAMVVTWTYLAAFDLNTGKPVYRIGRQ